MTFGNTLRSLREPRKLSQSALALKAGFSPGYVSRLESGARTPTRDAVRQLAAALKLDSGGLDTLLAAAGFLPKDATSLLNDEPEVASVLHLLADPSVSLLVRHHIRNQLAAIAVIYNGAAATEVAS